MKRCIAAVLFATAALTGCGEPKTYKLDQMHSINPIGKFYVAGTVEGVGTALTQYKAGDAEYTNLQLRDDTNAYTFYFLPSAHPRRPVAGDKVKLQVHFVVVDQSFAGGGRAPIIDNFEFQ